MEEKWVGGRKMSKGCECVKGLYCPRCKYVGLNCDLLECPECDTSLILVDIDKELLKRMKFRGIEI